jgi:hypothetical protein
MSVWHSHGLQVPYATSTPVRKPRSDDLQLKGFLLWQGEGVVMLNKAHYTGHAINHLLATEMTRLKCLAEQQAALIKRLVVTELKSFC